MKKKNFSRISIGIFLILASLAAYSWIGLAQNQDEVIQSLEVRLSEHGVPFADVSISQRLPLKIKIKLQSESSDERRTLDDLWFTHLAFREAALSHRLGFDLEALEIVYVNRFGKQIFWEQINLGGDELNSEGFKAEKALDHARTRSQVIEGLKTYSLILEEVDLFDFRGPSGKYQLLELFLSVEDIESANQSIPQFMPAFKLLVKNLNWTGEAQITLARIHLNQSGADKLLLDYIWDVELGTETWREADDLTQDWYPHPPSIEVVPTVRVTARPYVTSTRVPDSYPAPENKPYP